MSVSVNLRKIPSFLVTLATGLVLAGVAAPAAHAMDWKHSFYFGGRAGLFLHADQVGGGFRLNTQTLGSRTQTTVSIKPVVEPTFVVGYGLADWQRKNKSRHTQLVVEAEVSRFTSHVGNDTGFQDADASTRIILPGRTSTDQDGDENYLGVSLGKVTLTPILVHALLHWGGDRGDFFVGPGCGYVMAKFQESADYRNFVEDNDGVADVRVKGSFAISMKVGADFRLTSSGRTVMTVDFSFFTDNALGGGPKIVWPGVNGFMGQRNYDQDQDGVIDHVGVPADYRVMDGGKLRYDGAQAGIGIRYRFGGSHAAAKASGS